MEVSHSRSPDAGSPHPIGARLRRWWPAKMLGTTLGMTAFFVVYFWLLRHPQHPVITMPLTAIDRVVGFWPGALFLYLSLWVYVSLVPALLIDRREFVSYVLAAVVLSVIGLGTFFFWPTTVPPLEVDWSRHATFAMLKSVDASGNACPSLHVAFAVLTAAWLERLGRQMGAGRFVRALNWVWCGGVLYSTIAIRQHVALDVLAGAGLGAIVGVGSLRLLRAFPGPPPVPPVSQPTSCSGPGTTHR